MNFRFNIGRKIGLGFGVLIILTLVAFVLTNTTLNQSRTKIDQVTNVYTPSVNALDELNTLLLRSRIYSNIWFTTSGSADHSDKITFRKILRDDYQSQKQKIQDLAATWNEEDKSSINSVFALIEKLFSGYEVELISKLQTFENYEDANVVFFVRLSLEDLSEKSKLINEQLWTLREVQQQRALAVTKEMIGSFDFLKFIVKLLGYVLVIGGIVIATLTVRTIIKPVYELKKVLVQMAKGIQPTEKMKDTHDEIGDMSLALNDLVDALNSTTVFAKEVGAGNFDSLYKPLSDQDSLGHALLKMREDLRENERVLEAKVIERTEEVVRQKEEIETQNEKLEELYKQVTDSIRYAKRIQESILPPAAQVRTLLPNSFVLYKPKDIVSGDFYWLDERNGRVMFAAVDCTGHGVPGAFMSIVGRNLLYQAVDKLNTHTPSLILDELSRTVAETLHQKGYEDSAKDGMDIALISIDFKKLEVEYAGAFNPFILIRDGQLQQINADKVPMGFFDGIENHKFKNHVVELKRGDTIFIYSDGYADQFGGPEGKKFMVRRFRELLLEISKKPVDSQKVELDRTIEEWRGKHEQVDDILVMGLTIPN